MAGRRPRRFREKMPLSLFGRSSPRRKSRKQHEGRAEHGEERRAPPEKLVPIFIKDVVAAHAVVVRLVARSLEVGCDRLLVRERHARGRGPLRSLGRDRSALSRQWYSRENANPRTRAASSP